jgi:LysM repeat protein
LKVPVWIAAAGFVGWGVWQASEFRRSMLTETGVRARGALSAVAESDVSFATNALATNEPAVEIIVPKSGAEEWAAATTPAVLLVDAAISDVPINVAGTMPAEVNVSAEELLARGGSLVEAGRIVEGRSALNAALAQLGEDPRAAGLRQELASMNASVFLGPSLLPEDPAARYATIEPGDSYLKLGRTYGIPAALLESLNPELNPRNLKPGAGVKIVQGPFNLRLYKRASRIDLFARDLYVRSYACVFEDGNYLPVGTYRVSAGSKIKVGAKVWIGMEGIDESDREVSAGWIYGEAGPRGARDANRISGVKVADGDLLQLYNVLVESRSLLRVEP